MRNLAFFLFLVAPACVTPSEVAGGSHTYPPSPSASDVDAYGTARNPEIARCMSRQQMRASFGATLLGPSSVPENKSHEYQVCWCKTQGYRGLGVSGACV